MYTYKIICTTTAKSKHKATHTCAGNGVDAVAEVLDDGPGAALHSQDAGDLKDHICARNKRGS